MTVTKFNKNTGFSRVASFTTYTSFSAFSSCFPASSYPYTLKIKIMKLISWKNIMFML